MKICPNCQAQLDDNAAFCTRCGTAFAQPGQTAQPQYAAPAPAVDPYDHTDEFDAKDISDNKVFAMLPYLSVLGIIIALIASGQSPYTRFHVRQGAKFFVLETLVVLAMAVLCWTFIVPFAGAAALCVMLVLQIICFVQVCQGKAKEPAIICKFGFLK
ncbi:MAG: zinc ribbon domain-containing protein [Clostridia bacterium]|nr:zinc ribbon domain-containing protein [Clostridia bacterium]